MPLQIKYTLDVSFLEALPRALEAKYEKVVEKFAYDIKARAQYYVPVDQGAAKASIYVSTPYSSGKDEAIAEAKQRAIAEESRWGHQGRNLWVIDEDDTVKHLHALICVAVGYGYGLEHGFPQNANPMSVAATNPGARRPFLRPAVDDFHDAFITACAKVFEDLRGLR